MVRHYRIGIRLSEKGCISEIQVRLYLVFCIQAEMTNNCVAHGRAYGNGVYHSLDASVSIGYTNSYRNYGYNSGGATNGGRWWSKSHLCINSAMCLNEILNLPNQFT